MKKIKPNKIIFYLSFLFLTSKSYEQIQLPNIRINIPLVTFKNSENGIGLVYIHYYRETKEESGSFTVTEDNQVYARVWDITDMNKPVHNYGETDHGEIMFSQLTTALQNNSRVYIFGRNNQGKILYKGNILPDEIEKPWSAFTNEIFNQIAATDNIDGRILLAGLCPDGSVKVIWQLSNTDTSRQSWSSWKNLWGTNLKQLVCKKNASGRIVVFALSNDGSVYHCWQSEPGSSEWSNWAPLGGTELKKIDVEKNADGRLALFAIGGDSRVYEIEQTSPDGAWNQWTTLNGENIIDINSEISKGGRVVVFALHSDGAIDHAWQYDPNGGNWSNWVQLGTGFERLSSCRFNDGTLGVVAAYEDKIKYIRQKFPDGTWGDWQNIR